jgi:hypothetical protein
VAALRTVAVGRIDSNFGRFVQALHGGVKRATRRKVVVVLRLKEKDWHPGVLDCVQHDAL